MKYIKKFENIDDILFSVNDIVVCIYVPCIDNPLRNKSIPELGERYQIIRIYEYEFVSVTTEDFTKIKSYHDSITKEDYNNNPALYFDVKDVKTGEVFDDRPISRFESELKYTTDKYNL